MRPTIRAMPPVAFPFSLFLGNTGIYSLSCPSLSLWMPLIYTRSNLQYWDVEHPGTHTITERTGKLHIAEVRMKARELKL